MNIRDLEYLVALSEFKHFRRAADSCNVSQPTLSGQIRKLEDELGIILLERTSRKVLFTQSGMLLVEQARTVLREVKLLKEMASNQGTHRTHPYCWPLSTSLHCTNIKRNFPRFRSFSLRSSNASTIRAIRNRSLRLCDCGSCPRN